MCLAQKRKADFVFPNDEDFHLYRVSIGGCELGSFLWVIFCSESKNLYCEEKSQQTKLFTDAGVFFL